MIAAVAGSGLEPRRLLFTVQRELAERMVARPSTKAYSSFSVLCQARYSVRSAWDLAPGSFYPAPRVASRAVALEPRPAGLERPDLTALQAITRLLFAARRKTMRRSLALSSLPGAFLRAVTEGLASMGIDGGRRPEELTVEQFISLSLLVGARAPGLTESDTESEEAGLPED
jgi:16S rRNA (adenine1518-N6/adenine1519-N6)-dimethyltransferase